MATKRQTQDRRRGSASGRRGAPAPTADRTRLYLAIAVAVVALIVVAGVGFVAVGGLGSGGGTTAGGGTPAAAGETVVQGNGGHWTNVTPDRLAQMLDSKDFTLLNVKTPYVGEIEGTDLYIPYDQLSARAGELPASKSARILVYCRSGVESKAAAQTLLDLGYTNVWNLDGGMNAWTASGRTLISKNR